MLQNALKTFVLVSVVIATASIGYLLGRGSDLERLSVMNSPTHDANQAVTAAPKPTVAAAPGLTASADRSPASASSRPAAGTYEAMVESRGLAKKSGELAAAFPDNEAGHRLARVATLLAFGPAVATPEGQLVGEQLSWLKEHPDDAFSGIRDGLPRVGGDYAPERQYLVQLAAGLEVDDHTKMDFLQAELRGTKGADPNESVAALSGMLQNIHDAEEVDSALRFALRSNQDPRARSLLLSVYSAREPDRGRKIRDDLGIGD